MKDEAKVVAGAYPSPAFGRKLQGLEPDDIRAAILLPRANVARIIFWCRRFIFLLSNASA